MNILCKVCSVLFLIAGLSSGLSAKIVPSSFFADHMVIQRDRPFPVWGTAAPGEKVEVSFAGQTLKTEAAKDGRWEVRLSPLSVNCEPQVMTVKGAENEVKFSDILIGDLWLCSGQSNMEMSFSWGIVEQAEFTKEADSFPLIRYTKMARVRRSNAMEQPPVQIRWTAASANAVKSFSAAAYFFARKLVKEMSVPIGLVDASWSGSRIEPFIPRPGWDQADSAEMKKIYDELAAFEIGTPQWQKLKEDEIRDTEKWIVNAKKNLEAKKNLPDRPVQRVSPALASTSYNAMIAPYARVPFKGVIWYQGCANAGEGEKYFIKMKGLIEGFRTCFNDPELPFYLVQLAAFTAATNDPAGGNGYARIREAQRKTLTIPKTGMACTIDIGMQRDIHPKNKFDVGERLALWALKNEYGKKDVVVSGPLFRSMKVENGKIRLEFDYADGLMTAVKTGLAAPVPAPEAKPAHFAIAGADKKWFWADAVIDGKTVVVSSPEVKNPVAVRYAFRAYPDGVNVYNAAGLPMVPFRTDNW